MPVVVCHAYIMYNKGRIMDVNEFTPDYDPMQLHIVYAAFQYECPYERTIHILAIQNTLHVPSMKNNLLTHFMIREAGVRVNDTAKT